MRDALSPAQKPVEFFVSYAHQNAAWFSKLRPLLKFRHPPSNTPRVWHDQQLQVGDRWDKEIRAALEKMDVFVCLLSYEFLDSDYIMQVELPRALEREKNREIVIAPIVLYGMNLKEDCPELHALNPLPGWNQCWRDFEKGDGEYQDAHKPIRDGLRQAIQKVAKMPKPDRLPDRSR